MNIVMPQLGETVTEGTISVWHKSVGEAVEAAELLFEVSTDKVEVEVPAPAAGVLVEILVPAGETVAVGTTLAVVAEPAALAAANPLSALKSAPGGTPLSPAVRRLLAQHGLNVAQIPGSGRDGRIKRDDVLAFVNAWGGSAGAPAAAAAEPKRTVIPLSKIRRRIGEHMVASKATSAHVLQAVEVDFLAVEKARDAHGAAWKAQHGFSLTYLPFIARAVCTAVAEYPNVNASIEGEDFVVHSRINLAVAVDVGFEGLFAPVIKEAQTRSIAGFAQAIHELSERTRDNALSPDDLTEGTYTLSNSGSFGTLITAPIIYQPQVAILSTDGVRKKPVVVEGPEGDAIVIRPVGVLAQSFDHRAFDDAYSAAFLDRLRAIIETSDWSTEFASS